MPSELYSALPEALRQVLGKVRRRMQLGLDARDLNLTAPEAHVLHLVGMQPAITPLEIATQSGYDKAVVARKIKRMQASGLLTREKDAADHRRFNLHLTTAGFAFWEQANNARQEAHAEIFHALSPTEQKQLTQLLEKCL